MNAGSFDNVGNFFYRDAERMYKIPQSELAGLTGYSDPSSVTADYSTVWLQWTNDPNCNDYTSLKANFLGSTENWLVGLGGSNNNELNLIRTSGAGDWTINRNRTGVLVVAQ